MKTEVRMVEKFSNGQQGNWQKADARVLGQILAAQNVLFVLSDATLIAEFYAQTMISIPGITACRVCLGNRSVRAGEIESSVCEECETLRDVKAEGGAVLSRASSLSCNLAGYPDMRAVSIDSYENHFGFFTFKINDDVLFNIYLPFIKNLSGYIAITLENRLQKDLLQKAHDALDLKVKERTHDLTVANERFSLAASAANLGVWDWDIQKNELIWDERMYSLYGIQKGDLAAAYESWLKGVHPDDRARSENISRLAQRGELEYDTEFRVLWPDGSVHYLKAHGQITRDSDGRPLRMTGINFDITHQKLAEEETLRLAAIVESSDDAIIGKTWDGHIVSWNTGAERLYGYTAGEVIGKPISILLPHERRDELSAILLRIKSGEAVVHLETERRTKNGRTVDVSVTVSPIKNPDGEIFGASSIVRDITERKRAEEAVRRANQNWERTFNAISDLVMVLDEQHRIVRANKAMADALGIMEKDLIGRFCFEVVHNENQPPAFCPHTVLLKDGKEHSAEVLEPRLGRSLDIRVSPVLNESNTVIGSVHVIRDVTEQKNLQKQLLQAQKMESIGTLAGGIAHDFNNLLQVILGYSDMLLFKKNPTDPDYARLHAIRQAGRDGAELAKGILAFSRRLEPNAHPIDLNNEIIRVQKMLERTVSKMIRIEILLADNLMTVNADPGQMEQILLNLAINAQHAMPDGGRLTIETANVILDEDYSRTHLDVEPGKYVLLTVSDTGHGMDREVMEHIFEPFYTTKGPGEGTGLGLAMVFGIVKSHKGHIRCYSEPDTGTAFKIYLPAIFNEIEQDVAETRQMPAFGTETILLVDDEKSIRKLGEQMLRMAGYTVLTATNGIEALKVYRSNQDRIALVLLDLMMPEMGGKRCLQELLKINPRVRVVIASGYSANGPTKDALVSGAKEFVNKPFDVKDLLQIVRRTLDESGSQESPIHSYGGSSARIDEEDGTAPTETTPPIDGPGANDAVAASEFPRRLRILAIDDREPFLKIVEAGLAHFGQKVLTASSGEEGLRMVQEREVDLVICDLGLSDLDGWEVGRRIKKICREKNIPKKPFILLTGRTDLEDIPVEETARMADCGVDAILGKPIDIPEILMVAEKLMQKAPS
jgi:PAS domain S-box-containing protein